MFCAYYVGICLWSFYGCGLVSAHSNVMHGLSSTPPVSLQLFRHGEQRRLNRRPWSQHQLGDESNMPLGGSTHNVYCLYPPANYSHILHNLINGWSIYIGTYTHRTVYPSQLANSWSIIPGSLENWKGFNPPTIWYGFEQKWWCVHDGTIKWGNDDTPKNGAPDPQNDLPIEWLVYLAVTCSHDYPLPTKFSSFQNLKDRFLATHFPNIADGNPWNETQNINVHSCVLSLVVPNCWWTNASSKAHTIHWLYPTAAWWHGWLSNQ